MASTLVTFPASDALREALDAECGKRNIQRAALIRLAIAKEIGFDPVLANKRAPRPRIYDTPEERKEAARQRAATKRRLMDEFLAAVERGDREEDIKALARSLRGKIT